MGYTLNEIDVELLALLVRRELLELATGWNYAISKEICNKLNNGLIPHTGPRIPLLPYVAAEFSPTIGKHLHKLEADGLIARNKKGARGKQSFHVTGKGKQILKERFDWLKRLDDELTRACPGWCSPDSHERGAD